MMGTVAYLFVVITYFSVEAMFSSADERESVMEKKREGKKRRVTFAINYSSSATAVGRNLRIIRSGK